MISNIRKLRNEKQISQTTLANIIGKTQQTVSQMERDRNRIPIESLITMADYFGVTTDYILGIEDEEKPGSSVKLKEDPPAEKSMKDEVETLKNIADGGSARLIYELVLSLLLCSLEEKLKPTAAASDQNG